MDPPWSLLIRDEAPLCIVAVVRGHAWVAGTRLDAGDVAVIRGPDPYVVAAGPGRGPAARGPDPLGGGGGAGRRADDAHPHRRALRDARRRRGQADVGSRRAPV